MEKLRDILWFILYFNHVLFGKNASFPEILPAIHTQIFIREIFKLLFQYFLHLKMIIITIIIIINMRNVFPLHVDTGDIFLHTLL